MNDRAPYWPEGTGICVIDGEAWDTRLKEIEPGVQVARPVCLGKVEDVLSADMIKYGQTRKGGK
ncbi:hypothetical protein LCGC14_1848920 [marine sediment metagenome]|uniref:Uncharacterized protein n=1 Tax=marine sediment metagenome TaxID=412755 RepID=A0A0F9JA69_9ZZZZ